MHIKQNNSPGGRTYTTPHGDLPSVTTILNHISKPFLQRWAATLAARAALGPATESIAAYSGVDQAVQWAAEASKRHVRAASVMGSLVHDYVDQVLNGTSPDTASDAVLTEGDDSPSISDLQALDDHLAHAQDAINTLQLTPANTVTEFQVYDAPGELTPTGYAGTADLFHLGDDGTATLYDIKTSAKAPYPTAVTQLVAYAWATRHQVPGEGIADGDNPRSLRVVYPNLRVRVLSIRRDGWSVHAGGNFRDTLEDATLQAHRRYFQALSALHEATVPAVNRKPPIIKDPLA